MTATRKLPNVLQRVMRSMGDVRKRKLEPGVYWLEDDKETAIVTTREIVPSEFWLTLNGEEVRAFSADRVVRCEP